MASFSLSPDQRFPPGTLLRVYPASASAKPVGAQVTAATVAADSTVTFADLAEGSRYIAGTSTAGPFVAFATPSSSTPGNSRVLLWDDTAGVYVPTEWWTNSSQPREFVGPTDPSTIGTITVVYGDRWTPTEEQA